MGDAIPQGAWALERLRAEDAIGQLRGRSGVMAQLGSENGVVMLDWVEALPRLLAENEWLEMVEEEARALVARGVRHVVWAGMGGSVLTVQVLRALGFCGGVVTLHPLDSTDPLALDALLATLASAKSMAWPPEGAPGEIIAQETYRQLLDDVLVVGVAMGMTSEEPISHLEWLGDLLERGNLALSEHMLVMTLPGSYLDRYAAEHAVRRLPLQLDGGNATPGRMSAPATRVFLLPVALDLAARGSAPGSLRAILARAWAAYDLDGAQAQPAQHPYVRLAAALAERATAGACALMVSSPPALDPLCWWMEQLMEESLGKGGKGVVIFAEQTPSPGAVAPEAALPVLHLRLATDEGAAQGSATDGTALIAEPLLGTDDPDARLAGVAATFLGLQLTMALYGYLHGIVFAGQPAVESYKRRARELRATGEPLTPLHDTYNAVGDDSLLLLPPPGIANQFADNGASPTPAQVFAAALTQSLSYLDLTVNGELGDGWSVAVEERLRRLGNERLGVPVKLRRAPAAYHSTEQSEMDGPAGLVSLRALDCAGRRTALGAYDATFLQAQAVGTWQAMNEQGRRCFLLLYDGTNNDLGAALCAFLERVLVALPPRLGQDVASAAS